MAFNTTSEAMSRMSDEEVAELLLDELREMEDPERMHIVGGGEIKTAVQLIDHLERGTPEGLRYVRLFRKTHKNIRARLEKGEGGKVGLITEVKRAILQLLSKKD